MAEKAPSSTPGYITAGCGCLLTLMAMAVGAFGAFHVFIDPRGKISADEAAPALGGGLCCGVLSLLIFAVGIFLAMQAKKKAAAAAEGEAPPPAAAQPPAAPVPPGGPPAAPPA